MYNTGITIAFIITLLLSCSGATTDSTTSSTNSLTGAPTLVDTPRSFVKNYGAGDSNLLFVFVGEKISVEPLPHTPGSMDNSYKGRYAILKKVYGHFAEDTIEFVAYDHYGTPDFSTFKNVLLYVSADSGTYYHQKYMYNDVYWTGDGRWAGPYPVGDYAHAYNKHTKIKPVKINFTQRVAYSNQMFEDDEGQMQPIYPKPYFRPIGDSAVAVYGNYVEELFALKKTGILTARGLFEPTVEQEEDMVEYWQPKAPKSPPGADDLKFLAFWKIFVSSLAEAELKSFKKIALDSLIICNNRISTSDFISKCFGEVIDDEVRKRIVDRTKLEWTSSEVEFYNLPTSSARKEIVKFGKGYRFRQMFVTRSTRNNNPPSVCFDFIETRKGYRLYGIDHSWFKECCKY